MTRLTQAAYGAENAHTKPHLPENVNEISALQAEIDTLEKKIANLDTLGGRKPKNPEAKKREWEGFLAEKRAKLAQLTQEQGNAVKNTPETPKPAATPVEEAVEKSGEQRKRENKARNERRRNRMDALRSQKRLADMKIDAAMLSKESILTVQDSELDKAFLGRKQAEAELAFLEGGNDDVDAWKNTEEYKKLQTEKVELEAKLNSKSVMQEKPALAVEVKTGQIPSEADISKFRGRPSKDPLPTLETNQAALKILATQLGKAQSQTTNQAEMLEIADRLVQVRSSILTLEAAIGAKKKEEAQAAPKTEQQKDETKPTNSPKKKESENLITFDIEDLASDLIASHRLIKDCKPNPKDTLADLQEKAEIIDGVVRKIYSWNQQKSVKDLDIAEPRRLRLHKLSIEAGTLSRALMGKIYHKEQEEKVAARDTRTSEQKLQSKHDKLLESIMDGEAPYGHSLENLINAISADPAKTPDWMIESAEKELSDLLEVANERGIDSIIQLQKSGKDKRVYGIKYLERIHTFARKLDLLINRPEQLQEDLNRRYAAAGLAQPATRRPLETSDKARLKDFADTLERFLFMCKDNKIPYTKEKEITAARKKEAKEVVEEGGEETKEGEEGEAEATPATATTTSTPASTPAHTPALFKNFVEMPTTTPAHIHDDQGFNQWLTQIEKIFDQKNYDQNRVGTRSLEDLYRQYKHYENTLSRARKYFIEGDLDKVLGIRQEKMDEKDPNERPGLRPGTLSESTMYNVREKLFLELQYSMFEKGESVRDSLDQIMDSVEQSKAAAKEIKDLEDRVKTREKILRLAKQEKVSVDDAIAMNERNMAEFTRENIVAVEDFLEDMQNNYLFYAGAAKSLTADYAQDDIYDRYRGARGKEPSQVEKIGFFGRLKARGMARLGKLHIFRNASLTKEMSKRQEDKNHFWHMLKKLQENQLVPVQQGTRFREGAITQAKDKMDLLRKYINETFNGAPATLGGADQAKAKKMFEDIYNARLHNVTQSMDYQRRVRKMAKTEAAELPNEQVPAEIRLINSEISASEDWVARVFGQENPELVQGVKRDVFVLRADKFVAEIHALKDGDRENVNVLRESAARFKKLQADWYRISAELPSTDPALIDRVKEVHRIFTEKYAKYERLRVKKGTSDGSRLYEVVDRYTYVLQNTPTDIISSAEKLRLGRELIAEIEDRLARGDMQQVPLYSVRAAQRRLEAAMTKM